MQEYIWGPIILQVIFSRESHENQRRKSMSKWMASMGLCIECHRLNKFTYAKEYNQLLKTLFHLSVKIDTGISFLYALLYCVIISIMSNK